MKKLEVLTETLLLTVSSLVVTQPAVAEMANIETSAIVAKQDNQTQFGKIESLFDFKQPASSAKFLVQTPTEVTTPSLASQVLVTEVKINKTSIGVDIVLVTANSEKLQVKAKTQGNSFIANIENARLQLVSGDSFQQTKPAAGISSVTVANVGSNGIQVTVVGIESVPVVELFDSNAEGLVFAVNAASSTAQQPTSTPLPGETTPESKPKPPLSEQEPIELQVIGSQDTYRVPDTSVGSRTNTRIRDIPQSIQVIPRQVIEDQRVEYIGDALRNAGVGQSRFASRLVDEFVIRGFIANNILINGLRFRLVGSPVSLNTSNVDRIEVLRGPSSVLYGTGIIGGTINLVTKQPLRDPYYNVQTSFASYNSYKPSFDFSGPLTGDKKLLYRLTGDYLNANNFVDFFAQERSQVGVTLSWQIGENTKLTLDGDGQIFRRNFIDRGLPVEGTVKRNPNGQLPRNRYLGDYTVEDAQDLHQSRASYKFEHRFNEDWLLENAFSVVFTETLTPRGAQVIPVGLNPDKRTLRRNLSVFPVPEVRNYYNSNTQVTGKFDTGSIKHQLLVGFDFARDYQIRTTQTTYSFSPINIYNPVYGQSSIISLISRTDSGFKIDDWGFYLQDRMTLLPNLKLVLGGRFDWINDRRVNRVANTVTRQNDDAFSPRVGIVYEPAKNFSLYASYTRSFQPATGTSRNGDPFKPMRGTQYEVGVKADFLDNQLSTTLSLYDLTQTNVLTTDPDPRNIGFSVQTGEQNSKGVEFFVSGEILPGWNVIASYAYTDAKITKDNRYRVGNILALAPEHQASLWTTYIIPNGKLKGLGFGLGLFYVGDRQGDLFNYFELPSYVRTDAALFYRRDRLNVALNFQNLLNKKYFETAFNDLQVFYGSPLTATLTLGWQF
ncbi:TonB-dependent siderophore receptor [Scytonema sp. NUACC26]|uniref:TonB-dependent siderophore receptor n=1 Tax=Scytonema sp. NUACC26 TaxID=3140176 RepID=UPI0034DB9CAD